MDLKRAKKKKKARFQFQCNFPFLHSHLFICLQKRASVWQIPLGLLPFPHDEWNALSLTFVYKKQINTSELIQVFQGSPEQQCGFLCWVCLITNMAPTPAGQERGCTDQGAWLPSLFLVSLSVPSQAAWVGCQGRHLWAAGLFLVQSPPGTRVTPEHPGLSLSTSCPNCNMLDV